MFNTRLERYREYLGLKKRELADKLEVSESYYNMIENGKRNPSKSFIIKLVNHSGKPEEYWLYGIQNETLIENNNFVPIISIIRTGTIKRKNKIGCPLDAVELIYEFLDGVDREHLGVMCLNTKNQVLNISTVHIGSLNNCTIHPREIFKPAILSNAASIIIFHNHPSGDTTPSKEDLNINLRIKECGSILGIEMLDSIIVGQTIDDGYYSYKDNIG